MRFADRAEAGARLARLLQPWAGGDVVVLALPRGGVPVGFEVAAALGVPLDVIVVRKLGLPVHPELAMGAIGEGGVRVLNDEVIAMAGVTAEELASVEQAERAELERRSRAYRGDRPRLDLEGRTVLIVDDGIATGSTALAACRVARADGAERVVLAAPVAPVDTVPLLGGVADEVVVVATPEPFVAIGQFYADFSPTTDAEVVELLARADRAEPTPGGAPPRGR